MTQRITFWTVVGLIAGIGTGVPGVAHALDAISPSGTYDVGVTAGLGILSNSGGTHLNVGVEGDYQFAPRWLGGLFYNYIGRGTIQGTTPGVSTSASLSFLGLEGLYDLYDTVPGLQVGAKIALGWNTVSSTVAGGGSVDTSNTDFYIGPKVGWDVAVGGGFSVGGEANLLFTTGSASNAFNILAAAKYWF